MAELIKVGAMNELSKNPNTIEVNPRGNWTSASNAEADLRCPGRFLASRGLPEKARDDAAFGTQIHAALAKQKPDGLSLEQTEIYDACAKIEARLAEHFAGPEPKAAAVFRHRRFWLSLKNDRQTIRHSGEADVVYQVGGRLMILDYKTLPGEQVVSSKNQQLRDLAVLATGELVHISEVAVAIVQPLVTHSPDVTMYQPDDLKRAALELYARIVKSNDPNSPRTPGESQCQYCVAKPNCREYQAWAGAMTLAPRSLLDVPVAQWTGEQCSLFLDNAGIAQKWLDDAKDAVKARVQADPKAVPGWTLKPGANKETIVDPQACFDRFAALGGTIAQFMGAVTVGKGKLKEAVHAVTAAKGQSLDKAIQALTQGIVEQKQNAPSLVKG